MAEMTPMRKRVAVAFVAVGIALIVQRTIASVGDGGDAVVAAPVERPAHAGAQSDAGPAAVSPTTQRLASSAGARDAALRIDRLDARRQSGASPADGDVSLFAEQSWQPPSPPPAHVSPPVPLAPPFPYAYMGSLADDAGRTAFFMRGDRVLAVHAGDTVDGTYRVDHLDETSMTLTYVPLDKPLQVALGGSR